MNLPWLLSSAAIIVNKCMAYPGPKCLRKEKLEWIGGQNWEKSIFLQWLMDDVCTRSLAVNPLNASKDCTIRQVNDSVYMNIVAQCTHSLVLTLFSLQRRYQATCFTTTWSKQSICSRCSYIQFIIHLVYINGTKQKCKWVIVYCGCTPEYFHHISINDVIEISLFSLFSEVFSHEQRSNSSVFVSLLRKSNYGACSFIWSMIITWLTMCTLHICIYNISDADKIFLWHRRCLVTLRNSWSNPL